MTSEITSTPITRITPIAAATSGFPCSMPCWYISSTGDVDAPFGPAAVGQQVRLGEQVRAGDGREDHDQRGRRPDAGHGDADEAAATGRTVHRGRLVELLRHVLQRGEVEQDEEAELLPGDEDARSAAWPASG